MTTGLQSKKGNKKKAQKNILGLYCVLRGEKLRLKINFTHT